MKRAQQNQRNGDKHIQLPGQLARLFVVVKILRLLIGFGFLLKKLLDAHSGNLLSYG